MRVGRLFCIPGQAACAPLIRCRRKYLPLLLIETSSIYFPYKASKSSAALTNGAAVVPPRQKDNVGIKVSSFPTLTSAPRPPSHAPAPAPSASFPGQVSIIPCSFSRPVIGVNVSSPARVLSAPFSFHALGAAPQLFSPRSFFSFSPRSLPPHRCCHRRSVCR